LLQRREEHKEIISKDNERPSNIRRENRHWSCQHRLGLQ
jgi:hypothetical protein